MISVMRLTIIDDRFMVNGDEWWMMARNGYEFGEYVLLFSAIDIQVYTYMYIYNIYLKTSINIQ